MADDQIGENARGRAQGPVLAGVQVDGRGTLTALGQWQYGQSALFQLGGNVVTGQPGEAEAA